MALSTTQRHVTQQSGRLLSWQDALAILETTDVKGVPRPFSVVFVTADEGRGTGGEVVHYERAIWHVAGGRAGSRQRGQRQGRGKPAEQQQGAERSRTAEAAGGRERGANWIRRIRAVDSPEVRQVHVHLIISINGQDVR